MRRFLAWYGRLQLEGMALAATMSSETQTVFRQALDAIRDILDTRNLDDRYELLAAALLPVYEGLPRQAIRPVGSGAVATGSRAIEPLYPECTTERSGCCPGGLP
jgi:hypothetical protein